MKQLCVGAAKVCITPPAEEMPFPLGLHGAYSCCISDLFVRVCIMDNGKLQAAFIGYDLVTPPDSQLVKPLIEKETGISPDYIFLSATHNHTAVGPDFHLHEEESRKIARYNQFVLEKTVEVVRTAKNSLQPARYGYGTGKSYINMNRDKPVEDGSYIQAPDPEGYSDHTIRLIKFTALDGTLICAIVNYGMHATLGFLQPDADGQMKISSNIPGTAACYTEARYPGSVVIWTSGPAGDQNPYLFCLPDYQPNGSPFIANLLPGVQYQWIGQLGRQHGVDICRAIQNTPAPHPSFSIRSGSLLLQLPAQKPPARADMDQNRAVINRRIPRTPDTKLVEMEDDPEHPVPLCLSGMLLGNIALIGIPQDVYSRLGEACRKASPYKQTMLVVHTDNNSGYIVDREGAGHHTFQSFGAIKPGASDHILTEGVKSLFDMLLKE